MQRGEISTNEIGTNTINPQLGLFNLQQKKKPYDVRIKNFNPNEPKIKQNVKYSAKQNFRKYKSNIEPNLRSKIMIDEEDDMVNKIKKAFGMETTSKRNFTQTETNSLSSQGLGEINPRLADDDSEVRRYEDIIDYIFTQYNVYTQNERMTGQEAEEWVKEEFKKNGLSKDDVERIGNKIAMKRDRETQDQKEKRGQKTAEEFVNLLNEMQKTLPKKIQSPNEEESLESDVFGDLTTEDMDEVLAAPIQLFKAPEEDVGGDVLVAEEEGGEKGTEAEGEGEIEEKDEAEVEAEDLEEEPASPVSRGATTASQLTTEAAREAALTATGAFRGTPGRKPSTDPEKVAKRAEKIDKEEKKIKDAALKKALEDEEKAKEAKRLRAKYSKSAKE